MDLGLRLVVRRSAGEGASGRPQRPAVNHLRPGSVGEETDLDRRPPAGRAVLLAGGVSNLSSGWEETRTATPCYIEESIRTTLLSLGSGRQVEKVEPERR
ncbi:hypothetical protein NDU88_009470 [Pleurodeles waltl]|uniref:Uncharacterized protein n=1 Tax=Pleurodeles waltl TaxID=8319 RepID=A0AAV7QRQ9_PLEWA|nr:hypothetical protein NDU88_009470 [Pleurodeles waltl]